MVTLVGRVLSPGRGAAPGRNGQTALGGVAVDLYLCELRQPCLGTGEPTASTVTDPQGNFALLVPRDLLENKLRVMAARISPTLVFRAPVTVLPAGGAARSFGSAAGPVGGIIVDTISEAAVRLLAEQGIENFNNEGIAAIVLAVEEANAEANFEALTAEQAADLAEATAASDPTVQMTIEDNRLTPTPTPTIACVGDCNGRGEVTVDELIKGVNIALGSAGLDTCPAFDLNGDGSVTINEIITAVNNALGGCAP